MKSIEMSVLLVFCSFICSCYSKTERNDKVPIQEARQFRNDWQRDKDGCLKLRNERLALDLIMKHNLSNSNKANFIDVFGSPNDLFSIEKGMVLVYYFDCNYSGSTVVERSDKCYAKFFFEQDQLRKKEFICE